MNSSKRDRVMGGSATRARTSPLEAKFALIWRALGGPPLEREHRFAPPRGWRFDFASPEDFIAFEIEGGVWTGGRHNRPRGFINDAEKYNAAAALGWRVFRLPREMVNAAYVGALVRGLREKATRGFCLERWGGRARRRTTTPQGRTP